MRTKAFISVAVALTLLLAGAAGVYAYDSSREDTIADGVMIGGIDVGGLSRDEAAGKVRAELAEPLTRPIAVRHGKLRFRLSAADAKLRADVGGMVDGALSESRAGNIFSRVLRDVTGGEEDATIPPRVSFSRQAAGDLVKRVVKRLNRPARDATLNFPELTKVKEQDGLEVKRGVLAKRVNGALASLSSERTVRAPVRVTKAKVTRDELASKYPTILIADRNNFRLRLYKDLTLTKEYTVAVGAVGFSTPAGVYHIQNKAVNPAWNVPNSDWAGALAGTVVPGGTAANPLKARWMGIYDGAGIHGTDQTYSLGSAASHGCIRMAIPDVIELYDQVEVGTPIYIA